MPEHGDDLVHVRGGLWDQLIYWYRPGPVAYAAVERIVVQSNIVRRASGLATLAAMPKSPVIVSFCEEQDGRGPDGEPLAEPGANLEMFIGTFVAVEGGEAAVFFLTDPLRTSGDLTRKGVPGRAGTFERRLLRTTTATGAATEIEWKIRSAEGDAVAFVARYAEAAARSRIRLPEAPDYLADRREGPATLLYASRPAVAFRFSERSLATWYDAQGPGVEVMLKASHPDSQIDAIFNDRGNVPHRLVELRRLVRFERAVPRSKP